MFSTIFFIIIAVILLTMLELFIVLRLRYKLSARDREFIRNEWIRITKSVEHEPKHALIEADKLLDFVLQKMGYAGSLGDKLKNAAPLFSQVDQVWAAHKMRNRSAHEIGFEISADEVKKALSYIHRAITDLGVQLQGG